MTLESPAEKGFTTDQDAPAGDALAVIEPADLSMLDDRPGPGRSREYRFPRFERFTLANGLTVVHAHLPGRPLLAAQLLLPGGGWTEPADQAGVTVLMGRAMSEGTARRDANEFTEAAERLGAEVHAEATWETVAASVEVPKSRFGPALALLAEMVAEPAFPGDEVERLRDERLNDLLQAAADPRRRAERVFPETIYASETPYSRPLAGIGATVERLDRDAVAARHRALLDSSAATLVVAGDLDGLDLERLAADHLGAIAGAGTSGAHRGSTVNDVLPAPGAPRVVLVDKPGAPQSELRIGHIGVARQTPDYHVLAVLNAILGGTFGSRLNRVLREERGYTYGVHSSFDMRGHAGPFVVRTAVETAVTVPAILETLRILRDFGAAEVDSDELLIARDYLVGVFPLRFESAGQVASAISGLIVLGLPDDELDRYRPQVAAVSAPDILSAAARHVRVAEMSIVIVGDTAQVERPLREAGLGEVTLVAYDSVAAG